MNYSDFSLIPKTQLHDLADAIRTAANESGGLTVPEMTAIVSQLSAGSSAEDQTFIKSLIEANALTLTIPDYVTLVGKNAFYGRILESVSIPSSVLVVSDGAFDQCTALANVTLAQGVTQFGRNAFRACAFERIVIPSSVGYIGVNAFAQCSNCTLFDFSTHTEIPTLANTNAFSGINPDAVILVPPSLYDEWRVATNWVSYQSYISPV